MESNAVELDYEESFKEKVDGSYAFYPHLSLSADAYVPEENACQGFQEGPRTPVHFGQNLTGPPAPVAW